MKENHDAGGKMKQFWASGGRTDNFRCLPLILHPPIRARARIRRRVGDS